MSRYRCPNDLHRYIRKRGTRRAHSKAVYACRDCTHYLTPDFIVGKRARCIYCNNPFVISPKDKQLKFLHCSDCTKNKDVKKSEAIDELMKQIGVKE